MNSFFRCSVTYSRTAQTNCFKLCGNARLSATAKMIKHPQPTLTSLPDLYNTGIPLLQLTKQEDIKAFSTQVMEYLIRDKMVLINIDGARHNDPESVVMQQIVNHIGSSINQSVHFHDHFVWDVKFDEELHKNGAIGNGLDAFDFHTENAFDPSPVQYFGMHYVDNQVSYGGENVFISVKEILALLTEKEIDLLLRCNVTFKAPELFKKTEEHTHSRDTILFRNQHGDIRFRFRHSRVVREDTDAAVLPLIDKIQDLIHRVATSKALLNIPQNNILIWDNWYFLHSRRAILDSRRHLRRILFNV